MEDSVKYLSGIGSNIAVAQHLKLKELRAEIKERHVLVLQQFRDALTRNLCYPGIIFATQINGVRTRVRIVTEGYNYGTMLACIVKVERIKKDNTAYKNSSEHYMSYDRVIDDVHASHENMDEIVDAL